MKFTETTLHKLLVCYKSPILAEFEEDLSRMATIVRLLRKYKSSGEVNVKLLVNYMVISYNVFGADFTDVVKSHIEEDLLPYFNALLFYMGRDDKQPIDELFLKYINTIVSKED